MYPGVPKVRHKNVHSSIKQKDLKDNRKGKLTGNIHRVAHFKAMKMNYGYVQQR